MGKTKIPHLHRRNVYMTPETIADLEILSARMGGASRSQVIRDLADKAVNAELQKGSRARARTR